jgi:hypothetical protein
MPAAEMIEHPVKQHSDTMIGGGADQGIHVVVVAEARIYTVVIRRVIAVRLRFEDGPPSETGCTQLKYMVKPRHQVGKPVADRIV